MRYAKHYLRGSREDDLLIFTFRSDLLGRVSGFFLPCAPPTTTVLEARVGCEVALVYGAPPLHLFRRWHDDKDRAPWALVPLVPGAEGVITLRTLGVQHEPLAMIEIELFEAEARRT